MGGEKRGHGGGGRGGGGKKGKYMDKSGSSSVIPYGIRGFFLSCENGKESRTASQMKDAVMELYKTMVPKAEPAAAAAAGGEAANDIQASLAAEVAELKEDQDIVFKKLDHETGKGLCFIKMKYAEDGPTPPQLALKMMEDIEKTREKKARFCMRFMPIEQTCFAGKDEITKAVTELIKKHFPEGEDATPVKYSVLFEKRSHNTMDRSETIDMVAKLVPKPHTVDLTAPEKTILVSCIKSVCLLAVVDKYMRYMKYNVNSLSMTDEDRAAMVKSSQDSQRPPKSATAPAAAAAPPPTTDAAASDPTADEKSKDEPTAATDASDTKGE